MPSNKVVVTTNLTAARIERAILGSGPNKRVNDPFRKTIAGRIRKEVMQPTISSYYRALLQEGMSAILNMDRTGSTAWSAPLSIRTRVGVGSGRKTTSISVQHPKWEPLNKQYRKRKFREGKSIDFREYTGDHSGYLFDVFRGVGTSEAVVRTAVLGGGRNKYVRASTKGQQNSLQITGKFQLLKKIKSDILHDYIVDAFVNEGANPSLLRGASDVGGDLGKLLNFELRSKDKSRSGRFRPIFGQVARDFGKKMRTDLRRIGK